jgi:Asp-tRNA(Asn)/Glu-tRNA(Gln) amidotransferase A subunit family amidase
LNWCQRSATEQRQALLAGEVSATELLESTIRQAEQTRRDINALAYPMFRQARQTASAADSTLKKKRGGLLCGLPVTIKDSQWLAGVPCANGSHTLKDFVPARTSEAVRRLEAAGAIIFAKTTCPEFCVSGTNHSPLYGPTRNPWHLSYTPGGSSGGAAAAVASGVGSLALGSDGGGSIRIPASFCGVAGFKPSHELIPRYPGFPTWESLVSYGPLARSVADLQLMMAALTGDTGTMTDTASGPRRVPRRFQRGISSHPDPEPVIVSADLGFAPLDEDVRTCFHQVVCRLADAGFRIHRDNPGLRSSVVTWATLATRDMWNHKRAHVEEENTDVDALGAYASEFIRFGSRFSDADIADAQAHCRQIHGAYRAMFRRNGCGILLTPTMGCEAFPGHRTHPDRIGGRDIVFPWLDWAGFLYDANLTGMPACSIPMGTGDEGLPLGLQVLGPPGSDREVLRVARMIEQVLDLPLTGPQIPVPSREPVFQPELHSGNGISATLPP